MEPVNGGFGIELNITLVFYFSTDFWTYQSLSEYRDPSGYDFQDGASPNSPALHPYP